MFSLESQCWKIGDFHLTTIGDGETFPSSHGRGTPGYRAPELVAREIGRYSYKVDIFAMGCILFQLLKQERAFDDDLEVFTATRQQEYPDLGRKPSFVASEATFDFLNTLIRQMLSFNPTVRPTAKQVYEELKRWRLVGRRNEFERSSSKPEIADS
jgi:serine/threonine protein kinase